MRAVRPLEMGLASNSSRSLELLRWIECSRAVRMIFISARASPRLSDDVFSYLMMLVRHLERGLALTTCSNCALVLEPRNAMRSHSILRSRQPAALLECISAHFLPILAVCKVPLVRGTYLFAGCSGDLCSCGLDEKSLPRPQKNCGNTCKDGMKIMFVCVAYRCQGVLVS